MKLQEPKIILATAQDSLREIEMLYNGSLDQKQVSPQLKIKISDLLTNLSRSLEFSIYYIFETYCLHHYPEEDRQNKLDHVYFPVKNSKADFDKCIAKAFKGLSISKPEIVELLESCQPFNGALWLSHLTYLNNKNKHKFFSSQKRIIKDRIIKLGGINLINNTFGTSANANIMWNRSNISINTETQLPNEPHPGMQVVAWVDFIFIDLNISVMNTLKEIFLKTVQVVDELEKVV